MDKTSSNQTDSKFSHWWQDNRIIIGLVVVGLIVAGCLWLIFAAGDSDDDSGDDNSQTTDSSQPADTDVSSEPGSNDFSSDPEPDSGPAGGDDPVLSADPIPPEPGPIQVGQIVSVVCRDRLPTVTATDSQSRLIETDNPSWDQIVGQLAEILSQAGYQSHGMTEIAGERATLTFITPAGLQISFGVLLEDAEIMAEEVSSFDSLTRLARTTVKVSGDAVWESVDYVYVGYQADGRLRFLSDPIGSPQSPADSPCLAGVILGRPDQPQAPESVLVQELENFINTIWQGLTG